MTKPPMNPDRPFPDFIIIGFSKCGTTSLCSVLDTHPEVCMSRRKENNFFLWNYQLGQEWYRDQFSGSAPHQLRGDGSVFYSAASWERTAATRIVAANPRVKLVWIARHPLERLESSYREAHHSGHYFNFHAPYSIGEYLREAPAAIDDTRYWSRLNHYRDLLPDSQFHVLFLEDLVADRETELGRLCAFLGLSHPLPHSLTATNWLNKGADKLYDSRLMRLLRTAPVSRRCVKAAGPDFVDRAGRRIGLRRPFAGPIHWRARDRAWALDAVREDALRLLRFAGKPADFWNLEGPRVSASRSRRAAHHEPEATQQVPLLALQDAGWFCEDTGELVEGFSIEPADTVADIGCGRGRSSLFAARRGAEVIAVDVDAGRLESLQARLAESPARAFRVVRGESTRIPLPDATATKVVCMEVLEHVTDPAAIVAELARITKPGGRLLLSVPDPIAESVQQQVAPPFYWQPPHHVRVFERDAFDDLVRQAGLIIDSRHEGSFFHALHWILFWAGDGPECPNPALAHWASTWKSLLDAPNGGRIRRALDTLMPKNQAIIARKAA
ncbi:MAG: methyltransferase domain-containing protein [Planctomycetia bacterium]|nr:methyltransferase domain-containing protein [Planctomycetia bacterium]